VKVVRALCEAARAGNEGSREPAGSNRVTGHQFKLSRKVRGFGLTGRITRYSETAAAVCQERIRNEKRPWHSPSVRVVAVHQSCDADLTLLIPRSHIEWPRERLSPSSRRTEPLLTLVKPCCLLAPCQDELFIPSYRHSGASRVQGRPS
jgi:hypothetical protein